MLKSLFLIAALGLSTTAFADEAEAESCLRTKVWDGYANGWGIRTMTTATLDYGATRNYLVTFYPNKEYQIQTCGDGAVTDLDVVIYDLDGKVQKRDETGGKTPSVMFKTDKIATYYVVVHAKELTASDAKAGVAVAVTYR
ncbi:MAG: hypothetical protein AB8H79_26510 [Myxococcota bacterium]